MSGSDKNAGYRRRRKEGLVANDQIREIVDKIR